MEHIRSPLDLELKHCLVPECRWKEMGKPVKATRECWAPWELKLCQQAFCLDHSSRSCLIWSVLSSLNLYLMFLCIIHLRVNYAILNCSAIVHFDLLESGLMILKMFFFWPWMTCLSAVLILTQRTCYFEESGCHWVDCSWQLILHSWCGFSFPISDCKLLC